MRVLVVDDDVVVHMALEMTWNDIEVIECSRGGDAFRAGVTEQPDAFVIERHLPDVDGLELVRRFRKDLRTNQTPIVAVTVTFDPADEEVALASGADAYLAKPVEPAHLRRVLQALLEIPSPERRQRRQRSIESLRKGIAPEPIIDLTDSSPVTADWREDALRAGRESETSARKHFWQRHEHASKD
jgi:DNA-binding response OmpR family regulator